MTKEENIKKRSDGHIGVTMAGVSGALILTTILSAGVLSGMNVSADES